MRKLSLACLWPCLAAVALCAPLPYWQGTSVGSRIEWTSDDLIVAPADRKPFSFRQNAESAAAKFFAEMFDRETKSCTYERSLALLAIDGPFLSFRDEMYGDCQPAAHPTSEVRYTTIDLRRDGPLGYGMDPEEPMNVGRSSGMTTRLTDIFPAKAILAAFVNDPVVRPQLDAKPESLDDLPDSLGGEEGFQVGKNPCKFELPADYLTRFALHHTERNAAAVRVLLRPVGGACRAARAELGLLLAPAPAGALQTFWAGNSTRKTKVVVSRK